MDFKDKVCVVTGGANGIGRCIVEEFLNAGAQVAFIDVDADAGQDLAARYPNEKVLFACGDIAGEEVLTDFAGKVAGRFARVDFLINNACVTRKGILSGCGYEDFNYVLRVGVAAPYLLTKLFMEIFAKGASIVNICSTRAFMSQADTESYTAAKGGIHALTHALSISLSGRARVNSISPGWIDTSACHRQEPALSSFSLADHSQHPAGRIGMPRDIAKMVLYLCSDDASFITGENITVDGGMTKLMVYHNDNGWFFSESGGTN